jgi:hypothetical protein
MYIQWLPIFIAEGHDHPLAGFPVTSTTVEIVFRPLVRPLQRTDSSAIENLADYVLFADGPQR